MKALCICRQTNHGDVHVSFQIKRRKECCWSGSVCTMPDTSWCAEMLSCVTCEWIRPELLFFCLFSWMLQCLLNSFQQSFVVSRRRTMQQRLEERQADVEYELRCLLNKQGECASAACRLFSSYVWK